ncbi:MAG: metallophosphoesterase [Coraliomargaritaceae bacterium]
MNLSEQSVSHDASISDALAKRMGAGAYRERLAKEGQLHCRRGRCQHRGLFRLEACLDFYAAIRFCLRCCGLWKRAVRNYLDIRVETNEVLLEGLPPAFDGYRILQLTDLHADLHPDFPGAVQGALDGLEYDLAVVTGDFRTSTFGDATGATEASIAILSALQAPVYAVLGNHDFLNKLPPLEAAGVRFLLNENVSIERDGQRLYLVGIDDPNFYKTHDFDRALKGVPEAACKVLLSHSPEVHAEANARGFTLLLAGHTHGGQICLPGGVVVMHDGSSPRKFLSGTWRSGALQGYTSRGTGATGLPARLNCPPEVTLHTLRVATGTYSLNRALSSSAAISHS